MMRILRWTALFTLCSAVGAQAATDQKYSFPGNSAAPGYTAVTPDDVYTINHGFGFDLGSKWASGKPLLFSTKLGPGEYQVTVTLGDPNAETIATVKSETRRLMLQSVHVPRRCV